MQATVNTTGGKKLPIYAKYILGLFYKCAANIVSLGKVNSGELAHLITYKFVAEREYCLYVAWSNIFIYMSCTQ